VLHRLAQADPNLSVLALSKNVGQHRAVLLGFAHARGEYLASIDGDLQDPPEALPELLSHLLEGDEAVFAGRRGAYEPSSRLFTSRLFKTALHWVSGVPSDAGMYFVIRRSVAERLLAMNFPNPFVVGMIGCSGAAMKSIPVERSQRTSGSSAYSSWKRLITGLAAVLSVLVWRAAARFWQQQPPYQYPAFQKFGQAQAQMGFQQERWRALHNLRQRTYYDRAPKANMLPSGSPYPRRHIAQVIQAAGLRPGQRVLEVGCGMGRYTLLLAEHGLQVTGMDLSPVLLAWLRKYSPEAIKIPLFSADLLELPISPAVKFDVVFGGFMLHHLHDIQACLNAVAQWVRPGGVVAFLEPNPYNPLYYIQIALKPGMTWEGDRGMLNMRRSVLFPALQAAGFLEPNLTRFGFFPPFLANLSWGGQVERWLEAFPLWRGLLPFQVFTARRALDS
jgi:SAM-dependent methyltransferase